MVKVRGDWYQSKDGMFLVHGPRGYMIDLDDCRSSGSVCHWLGHLAEKDWMTAELLGDFVRALDAVIGLRGAILRREVARDEIARFDPDARLAHEAVVRQMFSGRPRAQA